MKDADVYIQNFRPGFAETIGCGLERLRVANVCVIGVGGVGSWTVEALARTGVGALTLIDLDDVCITNVNRQLPALDGQIGRPKITVLAERVALYLRSRSVEPNRFADLIAALLRLGPDTPVAAANELPMRVELANLGVAGLVVPRRLDALDRTVANARLSPGANHLRIMALGCASVHECTLTNSQLNAGGASGGVSALVVRPAALRAGFLLRRQRRGSRAARLWQAKAGSYPIPQHEIRLVPVVARMRRVSYRRSSLSNPRLADDLASSELVARQVDVDSRFESVPHVPLDPLSVEIHVRSEHLAADQIVNDQRRDVALTATRVLRRPSILLIRCVQTPGFANCLFQLGKSEHTRTVTPNANEPRALGIGAVTSHERRSSRPTVSAGSACAP